MKISIYDTTQHPAPHLKQWGIGLRQLGHQVRDYSIQNNTLSDSKNFNPDIILYPGLVSIDQFKGSPVNSDIILIIDNSITNLRYLDHVKLFVSTQHQFPMMKVLMSRIGAKILSVPLAGNQQLFYPLNIPKVKDICFIGTLAHGYRNQDKYLYPLMDSGKYSFILGGMTYKGLGIPSIEHKHINKIRNSTKININFHAPFQHRGTSGGRYSEDRVDLNKSVYDISLSKGFQICDHPLASQLFKGTIVLGNQNNWMQLIDYYLSHQKQRNDLASQAYNIGKEQHTWKARMVSFLRDYQEFR